MLNVGNILKSLSQHSQSSQNDVVTALSNFLTYHCQADELLTSENIQTFFQDCLEYPHWQQNKKVLAQEVYRIIDWTCRQQTEVFDFSSIIWPDEMQILTLELAKDWKEAVHGYLTYQHRGGEKFRVLHDELLGKMIGIILKPTGELLIRTFGNQFFIRHGALTPLREDLNLLYNSELELIEDVPQKLETGPYITTRFFQKDQELYGQIVRGYFFQKLQELNGEHYASHAKLFYCLKRIESHFLKRENDPYYQTLADDLEHSVKMIRIGDQSFIQNAPEIISRAQNALDYVFPNDKLLCLLLKDLQHTFVSERNQQTAVKQTGKDMKQWNNLPKNQYVNHFVKPVDLVELTKKSNIPQSLKKTTAKYDLTN